MEKTLMLWFATGFIATAVALVSASLFTSAVQAPFEQREAAAAELAKQYVD